MKSEVSRDSFAVAGDDIGSNLCTDTVWYTIYTTNNTIINPQNCIEKQKHHTIHRHTLDYIDVSVMTGTRTSFVWWSKRSCDNKRNVAAELLDDHL